MTVARRGPGRGIPSLRARGVRRFPPVIFPCPAGHIPLSAQVRDAAGERRTPGSRCDRVAPWPQDRRPCRPGETAGRAGAGREGTRRVRWPRPGDDAVRESPRPGNAVSAERNPRTRCPLSAQKALSRRVSPYRVNSMTCVYSAHMRIGRRSGSPVTLPEPRATLSRMEIWEDRQKNPVADEVSALVAVTGPIIAGVLRSVPAEVSDTFGERDRLPLKMLGHLRKVAEGDCGVTFEYALHDAVISREPVFVERVADALNKCGIARGDPASILFAIEKSGAQELISTEPSLVTDNSPVLLGEGGHPVSLRESLSEIGAAFRLPGALLNLTHSIRGLWKAELFLGSPDLNQWVRASVNMSNTRERWLATEKGPRIVIIPSTAGYSDAVTLDEQENVVICPVPHDGSFLRIFREGWKIVQTLCARNFEMPTISDTPNPLHREVARIFAERREFPIMEVVEATRKFGQPELLTTSTQIVSNVPFGTTAVSATSIMITPIARALTASAEMPEALASG